MSPSAPGIVDDYLEGLLHDLAAAGQDTPGPAGSGTAASDQSRAPEQRALSPAALAAAVLAEADADPALDGPTSIRSRAPEQHPLPPAALAAAVLAEADADPALDAPTSIRSSAPEQHPLSPAALAAAVLAEADADPALDGPTSGASARLAHPGDARAPAAPDAGTGDSMHAPASQMPANLQSFMPSDVSSGTAAPPRNRRAPDRSSRWLRLRCGGQVYALELLKVQEVVLPVPLLPLRGTPPSMLGIMNLRGQVVPVIDLGLRLDAAPVRMDALTRIVVLEDNGQTLGLRVSAVEDVTSLTDQQIELPDTARICRISNDLFRGVARLAGPPMILLDAEQLLH